MSSIAVLDDPFPLAAQSTIVRAGGIVRDPTLGQVPPDGALVESVCSRSASKAIFAFSAASIFRLGFFIIRSVYHDRAGRSPIKPPVPKSGSTSGPPKGKRPLCKGATWISRVLFGGMSMVAGQRSAIGRPATVIVPSAAIGKSDDGTVAVIVWRLRTLPWQ